MIDERFTISDAAPGRFVAHPEIRFRWAAHAAGLGPFAAAGFSGLLFASAFPPVSWSIAAWVSLAPLLVACSALSPWRAAVAGMCWTAAAGVGVASFLPHMLAAYFGLPLVPSWVAATAIIAALHGLAVSGYAAWVAWLVQRRAAHPFLLAAGWVVCELARASGPLGAPWAAAAYSQLGSTRLIQSADLAGPYAIAMLIAAVNACAAAWLVPALRGRRPRWTAVTTAAAVTAAVMYGEWRLGESFGDGPPVHVAVVQGGATPADPAERSARFERYLTLTRDAAAPASRLIVWPEYATEAYLEEASPTRDAVQRVATATGGDLILGGPHYESSPSGTRYHNSAYLVRDGRLAARYDKHRLVPGAEDDRVVAAFGATPSGYAPGSGGFVLPSSALRVGTLLCFEAMFPGLGRAAVRDGAEILVNLSNDAWFGDATAARQQLDIAALRAVENRRYLVRAAATGVSAVIDPYGRVLTQSAFDAVQVLNATVRASHVRTPYQRWGDTVAWLAVAAVASATVRLAVRSIVTPQP